MYRSSMERMTNPRSSGETRRRGVLGRCLAAAAIVIGAGVLAALAANARPTDPQAKPKLPGVDAERAIRAVLDAQVVAWNRGDIDAFMEGYARSESTRFASDGTVIRGWQTVRDRYRQRYGSREKMGTLTFSDLEVSVLAPDAALVFGRWRLERSGASPNGLFTLQFASANGDWRIVADHTSSAEPTPPPVGSD
jgi:uncharacterized protein (TIGR02246 family)